MYSPLQSTKDMLWSERAHTQSMSLALMTAAAFEYLQHDLAQLLNVLMHMLSNPSNHTVSTGWLMNLNTPVWGKLHTSAWLCVVCTAFTAHTAQIVCSVLRRVTTVRAQQVSVKYLS